MCGHDYGHAKQPSHDPSYRSHNRVADVHQIDAAKSRDDGSRKRVGKEEGQDALIPAPRDRANVSAATHLADKVVAEALHSPYRGRVLPSDEEQPHRTPTLWRLAIAEGELGHELSAHRSRPVSVVVDSSFLRIR